MSREADALMCPVCGRAHPGHERFCHACGLPLVIADAPVGDLPVSERHERARKVKPQYAEGDLVKVGWALNQADGEFMQGLLLEEGVPSMLRRARGVDVPEMLAAGPRDVMVPRSGYAIAREVLMQAELLPGELAAAEVPPLKVLAGLLGGIALVALIVFLGGLILF